MHIILVLNTLIFSIYEQILLCIKSAIAIPIYDIYLDFKCRQKKDKANKIYPLASDNSKSLSIVFDLLFN